MIRRQFFSATLGSLLSRDDPRPTHRMGEDRREWLRWTKDRWVPIELVDVRKGDVILQIDVESGAVNAVQVFCAGDESKDGKGIEVSWYVDLDELAQKGPKKKDAK